MSWDQHCRCLVCTDRRELRTEQDAALAYVNAYVRQSAGESINLRPQHWSK